MKQLILLPSDLIHIEEDVGGGAPLQGAYPREGGESGEKRETGVIQEKYLIMDIH